MPPISRKVSDVLMAMGVARLAVYIFVAVCTMLVISAREVKSQGYAMLRRNVYQEEFARILDTCGETTANQRTHPLMRATCEQFFQDLNRGGAGLVAVDRMGGYIRSLVSFKCPAGEAQLSRIIVRADSSSVLDNSGRWSRPFRDDEMCLWDNNLRRWMVSLSCGNLIINEFPAPMGATPPPVSILMPSNPVRPDTAPRGDATDPRDTVRIWFRDTVTIELGSVSRKVADSLKVTVGGSVIELRRDPLWQSFLKSKPDTVEVEKVVYKKVTDTVRVGVSRGWLVAAFLGGGIVGSYVWDRVDKPCKCRRQEIVGGPVNPPNADVLIPPRMAILSFRW